MSLEKELLKKLIQQLLDEEPGELNCTDCFEILDRFAELKLSGHIPSLEMPLVQEHLNHCDNCREQFEMLVDAMKSLDEGSS